MNDSYQEFLKAIECCTKEPYYIDGCFDCTYFNKEERSCRYDHMYLPKKALEFLNKKDAEIERLNALNKVLKDNNYQCHRLGYEDAITEFAERLKAQAIPVTGGRGFEGVNRMATNLLIDKIAKEMKEQNDEKKS